METLAFVVFAALTVGGGLLALFHRDVVHSAFSLMGSFFGVAGLFLLLGADFLAVTQVLIYVGGILVLILFGIMLSPVDRSERSLPRVGAALLILSGVGALVATKVAKVAGWITSAELPDLARSDAGKETTVVELGKGFLDGGRDGYLIPFELSALVLLVALIGAVFIARRRPTSGKGFGGQGEGWG